MQFTLTWDILWGGQKFLGQSSSFSGGNYTPEQHKITAVPVIPTLNLFERVHLMCWDVQTEGETCVSSQNTLHRNIHLNNFKHYKVPWVMQVNMHTSLRHAIRHIKHNTHRTFAPRKHICAFSPSSYNAGRARRSSVIPQQLKGIYC